MAAHIFYLLFFYIGLNYSLAGIATPFVAKQFAVEPFMVGYAYSLYSIGQTLGVLGNVRFLGRIAPNREVWFAVALLVASIMGITSGSSLIVFGLSAFGLGAGAGIFSSVANYAIVATWDGRDRAVRINLINFFFSFGAIVSPVAAGILLEHGAEWESLYRLAGLFLIFAAGFAHRIPANVKTVSATERTSGRWGANVYLTGLALFTYVLAEIVVSYWVVSYLRYTFHMELSSAGLYLSVFWGAIAVGRFCSGLLAGRFAAYHMILTGAALATLSYIGFLVSASPAVCALFIALMGFGCSGLYASILSYGTQQAEPSPGLTTFFVSLGCAGGIVSYALSSLLNQLFGLTTAMAFGAVLMGIVFVLVFVADRLRGSEVLSDA